MGPLSGVKVVEMAGIGPGPFCATLLADMGAEVIRVDRVAPADLGLRGEPRFDLLRRGRRSIALDMKKPEAVETVLRLVEQADALIEGFRPGVAERMGIGPDVCRQRNAKLVYGRMTGWGQDGPIAHAAGHDINYIALAGALHAIGTPDKPLPPLNLVGDFGGGAMFLAFGVVAALYEAARSGQGQVVDASMVEGAGYLMMPFFGMSAAGFWTQERGANVLDGGAHFYNTYETKDGKHICVGSIEGKFYAELLRLGGLEGVDLPDQHDRAQWPQMKERLAELFRRKTRDEWCAIMEGSDVCFAPVLSLTEVHEHPQNAARQSFVEVEGVRQPAPAPRFSRTRSEIAAPPSKPGQHTRDVLRDWGFASEEIAALEKAGAAAHSQG